MGNTDLNRKDGDLNAVEPQSTYQSIENTFSHILHELKTESIEIVDKSLLQEA